MKMKHIIKLLTFIFLIVFIIYILFILDNQYPDTLRAYLHAESRHEESIIKNINDNFTPKQIISSFDRDVFNNIYHTEYFDYNECAIVRIISPGPNGKLDGHYVNGKFYSAYPTDMKDDIIQYIYKCKDGKLKYESMMFNPHFYRDSNTLMHLYHKVSDRCCVWYYRLTRAKSTSS